MSRKALIALPFTALALALAACGGGGTSTPTPAPVAATVSAQDALATATPIRENVALRELFGHRQPIRTYRPDSTGAADYATVAAEVLQRAH